jgi:hypothetical protein
MTPHEELEELLGAYAVCFGRPILRKKLHALLDRQINAQAQAAIPGLAQPWRWIQPRNDEELIKRLQQAADYMVHERERENLCSVAAYRLKALTRK